MTLTRTNRLSPAERRALAPPEQLTVSEWVDRNVVLGGDSSEPGPYQTDRTPYVREWQDSAALPWVHQVTIQKSTQVGGSQALLNVLAYAIAADPGPISWVMPTREDAAEFGENRVQPMVDLCPTLRAQMTGERFDAKARQIRFRRCRLLFRSARVPKELAQYAARWLFGDEAGKWPQWTQDEAAPFDLARERCRTFWNHRIYLNSTPTTAAGLISVEFQRGDRRRYHVPCPHCGKFQVLVWKNVKWPAAIDTEKAMRAARCAWYECAHCGKQIADEHKRQMLSRGWWCPEDVDPDRHVFGGRLVLPNDRAQHRSYHLWAGYSPWLAWWELVAEWLRSKDTPATLQNFVNSWLGEPWVEKLEETKPEQLQACVGGYHRGQVPDEVRVLTAGVDVQKRFLAFTVRGWGTNMQSWLIDHGRVDTFDQLQGVLFAKQWPRGLMLRAAMIDTRYRQPEVVEFARRFPAVVRLCRGVEMDNPIPFRAEALEKHPMTGAPMGTLKVWHLNVGFFKDLVHQSIRVGGVAAPEGFHIYEEADQAYLEELCSEHKVMERSGEREKERWVKRAGHRQNHYWDTEVYNRAVAQLIGVHTLKAATATPTGPPRRPPQSDDEDGEESLRGRLWRRTT
jgi:phage terminase large subunit GpA-like protein